jgi:hypothetical protein
MNLTPSFPRAVATEQVSETLVSNDVMPVVSVSAEKVAEESLLQLSPEERKRLIAHVFADDVKALVHQETQAGRAEGFALGQADAGEKIDKETAELKQQLAEQLEIVTGFIDRFDVDSLTLQETSFEQMYGWAVKACYQVLLCELTDPTILTRQLQTLIKETVAERELILEVHSSQVSVLKPALVLHPNISKVVANEQLKVGEFRLRLGRGEILSSLPSRLDQFHQLILVQLQRWQVDAQGQS